MLRIGIQIAWLEASMFSNSGMQIQNQGILGEIVCGVNLTGASCSSKVFGDQLR